METWSKVTKAFTAVVVATYVAWILVAPTLPGSVERPQVEDSPAAVLELHPDCWTGDAPADVETPGAVIWQHPSGRTEYRRDLVGRALNTTFGAGNLPGRAIAFCR